MTSLFTRLETRLQQETEAPLQETLNAWQDGTTLVPGSLWNEQHRIKLLSHRVTVTYAGVERSSHGRRHCVVVRSTWKRSEHLPTSTGRCRVPSLGVQQRC